MKAINKVVVGIHGDPLHRGHIEHIRKASELGEVIVIMGSDEQIKRKYGYVLQPLYKRFERLMRKTPFVRGVIVSIDRDGTQVETLRMLEPMVFAKGGDRTPDNMPQAEIDVCKEIGCQIVYGVGKKVNSSTAIRHRIEKFRNNEK